MNPAANKKSLRALSSSQEDYLEAVLVLIRDGNHVARVRDIAKSLGVGMPSVTTALKALSRRGLVNYDPYQYVTLTPRGQLAAEQVVRRHETLRRFLREVLALDAPAAEENACRMEHAVDEILLERLGGLVDFLHQRAGEEWLREFHAQCAKSRANENSPETLKPEFL
jgi:DtxR family Mn-dependent transcriptional regulator